MRHGFIAVLVLATATGSNAEVYWSESSVPTASLPGYLTYTITLSTDNDDFIVGWEGAVTGPDIHQQNPFGSTVTIFQDNNSVFDHDPTTHLDADSQYLFLTNVADPSNGVVAATAVEGPTELSSIFGMIGGRSNENAGTVVPLAQVCVPDGGEFTLTGIAMLRTPTNALYSAVPIHTPAPTTLAVLALGGAAVLRRRRRI